MLFFFCFFFREKSVSCQKKGGPFFGMTPTQDIRLCVLWPFINGGASKSKYEKKKNQLPIVASSVLEVYTACTLPIATLQVHCPKKLLRLGQEKIINNKTSIHLSSSRFFRSTSGLFWWDGNPGGINSIYNCLIWPSLSLLNCRLYVSTMLDFQGHRSIRELSFFTGRGGVCLWGRGTRIFWGSKRGGPKFFLQIFLRQGAIPS